jgi:hypothetical protein
MKLVIAFVINVSFVNACSVVVVVHCNLQLKIRRICAIYVVIYEL